MYHLLMQEQERKNHCADLSAVTLHGEGDVVVGGKTTLFNCLFRRAITQDQIFVNYLLYMESHSGGEV